MPKESNAVIDKHKYITEHTLHNIPYIYQLI